VSAKAREEGKTYGFGDVLRIPRLHDVARTPLCVLTPPMSRIFVRLAIRRSED
jgi:hypothetical protein